MNFLLTSVHGAAANLIANLPPTADSLPIALEMLHNKYYVDPLSHFQDLCEAILKKPRLTDRDTKELDSLLADLAAIKMLWKSLFPTQSAEPLLYVMAKGWVPKQCYSDWKPKEKAIRKGPHKDDLEYLLNQLTEHTAEYVTKITASNKTDLSAKTETKKGTTLTVESSTSEQVTLVTCT